MYEPDARELADERVYAHNVRDHMAKWLHVGTVDESVGMTNSGKGFRRTDLGRTIIFSAGVRFTSEIFYFLSYSRQL